MSDVAELFKKCEDEFLKFDDISNEDKLHPNSFICSLLYLYPLVKEPMGTVTFNPCAEHDVIYLLPVDELTDSFSDKDALYLSRCGVTYNKSSQSLIRYC